MTPPQPMASAATKAHACFTFRLEHLCQFHAFRLDEAAELHGIRRTLTKNLGTHERTLHRAGFHAFGRESAQAGLDHGVQVNAMLHSERKIVAAQGKTLICGCQKPLHTPHFSQENILGHIGQGRGKLSHKGPRALVFERGEEFSRLLP